MSLRSPTFSSTPRSFLPRWGPRSITVKSILSGRPEVESLPGGAHYRMLTPSVVTTRTRFEIIEDMT